MLKSKIAQIEIILKLLDKKLENRDLYDYISGKLASFTDDVLNDKIFGKVMSVQELENGIKIENTKNEDSFQITFSPSISNFSTIATEEKLYHKRCTVKKKIIYDEENITVQEFENTAYKSKERETSSIEKKIKEGTYFNNQLIYEYSFESQTSISEDKKDGSIEEILYVLPDKRSVARISVTGQQNYFGEKGITYRKANDCDEPNFDTRKENKGVYVYGTDKAAEEEYNEFVTEWKEMFKNLEKKKV